MMDIINELTDFDLKLIPWSRNNTTIVTSDDLKFYVDILYPFDPWGKRKFHLSYFASEIIMSATMIANGMNYYNYNVNFLCQRTLLKGNIADSDTKASIVTDSLRLEYTEHRYPENGIAIGVSNKGDLTSFQINHDIQNFLVESRSKLSARSVTVCQCDIRRSPGVEDGGYLHQTISQVKSFANNVITDVLDEQSVISNLFKFIYHGIESHIDEFIKIFDQPGWTCQKLYRESPCSIRATLYAKEFIFMGKLILLMVDFINNLKLWYRL
jgi:hypothetical protein